MAYGSFHEYAKPERVYAQEFYRGYKNKRKPFDGFVGQTPVRDFNMNRLHEYKV